MAVVKVRVGEANQSRSLGTVAFTCPQCARREGAYATLHWRVRRAAGIPMVSGLVCAVYRCVACDAETKGRPPAGVVPPFMHRYGGLVVIAVVVAAGALVLKLATPEPQPVVSQATQAQLEGLRTRVNKAGLVEVTADIECRKVVDAALAKADFWTAKPVAPSEPLVADDLPVVVDEAKNPASANNLAPEFMPKRACTHQTPNPPYLFVAAGADEAKDLAALTAKVEAYEAEIAKLVPPDRFVYVEAECLAAQCSARAAAITRDGTLLALSVVKLRALGTAIKSWAKPQQP
jgi:hypothetical protein